MNILEYPEFLEQAIKISQTRFLKVKTWIPNLADIQIYWEAPSNTFENFYGFHFFIKTRVNKKWAPPTFYRNKNDFQSAGPYKPGHSSIITCYQYNHVLHVRSWWVSKLKKDKNGCALWFQLG